MSNQRDALLAASLEKQRGLSNELYDLLGESRELRSKVQNVNHTLITCTLRCSGDTSDWEINPQEDGFSAEGAEGTWVGPLGERMGAGSELNSGWGSSDDDETDQNEDFLEKDEEADEEVHADSSIL